MCVLTFHIEDPGEQTDHEQKAHGTHEHGELIPRAPRLPVDGGRSAEAVHDREVRAARHRGGVRLLRRRHRGRMYSGEVRQIRGRQQQRSRRDALQKHPQVQPIDSRVGGLRAA